MSYGLRVWDASGNIIVDITDRITKLVSTHSFSKYVVKGGGPVTHDVPVPGILADGSWFVQGTTKSPQVVNSIFYSYEIMSGIVRVHILKFAPGTYTTTGTFTVYKV